MRNFIISQFMFLAVIIYTLYYISFVLFRTLCI